jgi:hypothetical protein
MARALAADRHLLDLILRLAEHNRLQRRAHQVQDALHHLQGRHLDLGREVERVAEHLRA